MKLSEALQFELVECGGVGVGANQGAGRLRITAIQHLHTTSSTQHIELRLDPSSATGGTAPIRPSRRPEAGSSSSSLTSSGSEGSGVPVQLPLVDGIPVPTVYVGKLYCPIPAGRWVYTRGAALAAPLTYGIVVWGHYTVHLHSKCTAAAHLRLLHLSYTYESSQTSCRWLRYVLPWSRGLTLHLYRQR